MTVDLELYPRFLALLQAHARGEARSLTASSLMAALDLPASNQSRRHLRACAQHAVKEGHLVCTANRGYYVPATRAEADVALSRLTGEAFALLDRARRARRLSAKAFGPEPWPVLPLFEEMSA